MKKVLFLFLSLSLFQTMDAQILSQWRVSGVQSSFGQDQDMLHAMDHEYFLQTTKSATEYDYTALELGKSYIYSMLCENPHLRLGINLQHKVIPQLELSMNMVGIFNRIDEVVYGSPGLDWGDEGFQQLRLSQYTNEVALEPTTSYRLQKGTFSLIGGLGGNVGYVFGGSLNIAGSNLDVTDKKVTFRDEIEPSDFNEGQYVSEYRSTRNGFSTRIFASLGGSFTVLKRVEVGANYRYGFGKRFINGADAINTELHSFGLFAAWKFR